MEKNISEYDFKNFYFNLKIALNKIEDIYINIPILNNGKKTKIHRERVYCYELYHQLRCQLSKIYDKDYFLFGEEDKRGIYKKYELNKIPDFIFHIPGSNNNIVIIEVKSITAKRDGILKDFYKIRDFIKHNNYKYGILLFFGEGNGQIPDVIDKIKREIMEKNIKNIKIIWHKYTGNNNESIKEII